MQHKEEYKQLLDDLFNEKGLVFHNTHDNKLNEDGAEYFKLFRSYCIKNGLEAIPLSELIELTKDKAEEENKLFMYAYKNRKHYILGITLPPKKNERVDITQDVANFIEEYNYTIEENGKWIECNELYTDYIMYTEQPTKPTRTAVTKALTKVGLSKGVNIKIKVKKNRERKSIRVYSNISK